MARFTLKLTAGSALALAALLSTAAAQPANLPVTVYKSATCGCCAKWVEHVKKAGFAVTVKDVPNVGEVKLANGVPVDLALEGWIHQERLEL